MPCVCCSQFSDHPKGALGPTHDPTILAAAARDEYRVELPNLWDPCQSAPEVRARLLKYRLREAHRTKYSETRNASNGAPCASL